MRKLVTSAVAVLALASAPAAATATTTYDSPFSKATGLVPERIDMGVAFVGYTLLDGPYAGRHVYVAEDIVPQVSVGQTGTAGQMIATSQLQSALRAHGYLIPVTGRYGLGTYYAVRSYESAHGFTANGIVTQAVWNALVG